MKHSLLTISLCGFLGAATFISPAFAGNSSVEATLQSLGDLSMFYQALLNTGVINELNEHQHYTIFAPTNAAFAQIDPRDYPCFYSTQCRPQIADLLRDHIITGPYNLKELTSYADVQTMGPHRAHVEQAYVGDYRVDGAKILSESDAGGNIIYRINGVIASPQELRQFQTVSFVPAQPTTTVTRTVTTTYRTPGALPEAYPGEAMDSPGTPSDDESQTITVIHTTKQQ